MPPPQHVFFDLDGTLVDSLPGIAFSVAAAINEVVPGHDAPGIRALIGPPIRVILERALDRLDAETIDRVEQAFRRSYNRDGWKKSAPYPGALETIAALNRNGHACHVLTNKPRIPARQILEHLGLASHLKEIITPESGNPRYPTKTAAALDAAGRLGISPGKGIIVGDSLDDAAAAEACGFLFAAVTFGYGRASTQTQHPVHLRLAEFSTLADALSSLTNLSCK